jgi:hypothetical protein
VSARLINLANSKRDDTAFRNEISGNYFNKLWEIFSASRTQCSTRLSYTPAEARV